MTVEIDPSLPHYDVRVFLAEHAAGLDRDHRIAELLHIPVGPAYSTDLNAVVSELNKTRWWWHLSHLEAVVMPTTAAPGMEGVLSNSRHYDREGKPIRYTAIFSRDNPALALCEAWIKAVYDLPAAFAVEASEVQKVLAETIRSKKEMMAYYRIRENLRQESIKRLAGRVS